MAISLAYVPYRLLDPVGTRHVAEIRSEMEEVRVRQAKLTADNARLRREIDGLRRDPSVIEDIAREDLGMVRADEIIIRVVAKPRRP